MNRDPSWRLDPAQWAQVHDRSEARHFAFWRAVELVCEVCAERVKPADQWLDIGTGPGHLAASLARLGARVVGLDLDPRMARYAHHRWRLPSAVADAAVLPVADRSCAGIVAVSLLGCLPLPAGFFAAAERALSPGGTLCFTAMNRRSLLLAAGKALAWRPSRARYAAHDPAVLVAALSRAGLEPERQILYGHFLGNLPGPATSKRLEGEQPPGRQSPWARQVLLVARKPA